MTATVLSDDTNKNKTAQPPIVTVSRCDICNYDMDGTSSGIPSDAANKLYQYTSWVCTDCHTNSQQKIDKLQAALTLVSDKLSDLMATVDNLQQKLENSTRHGQTNNDNVMSKTDIADEIQNTLSAESKRKCNIIITGLPESSDVTDEQAFLTYFL